MTEVYHLAALGGLVLAAVFWRTGRTLDTVTKLALTALSAWGAIVVAIDWVRP